MYEFRPTTERLIFPSELVGPQMKNKDYVTNTKGKWFDDSSGQLLIQTFLYESKKCCKSNSFVDMFKVIAMKSFGSKGVLCFKVAKCNMVCQTGL